MDPRRKDSLLWGVVGSFAFLVLVQGYELTTGNGVAALVKVAGAAAVLGVTAVAAHRLRSRLAGNERN